MQRKRFIKILALGLGSSSCGFSSELIKSHRSATNPLKPVDWQGYVLGSHGSMRLYATNRAHAKKTLKSIFKEIQRLEQKFSLYLAQSEINQLNKTKVLKKPDSDWLSLCQTIDSVHSITKGYFDPSVQSLWNFHTKREPKAHLATYVSEIGWAHISHSKSEIRILRPSCQLTLNGIAQGFITDKATDILKNEGFNNALIELGESKALGEHPEKRPFKIALQTPEDRNSISAPTVELSNQALATSSTFGSYLKPAEKQGHILNPKTGKSLDTPKTISVIAKSAASADALSTGLLLLKTNEIESIKKTHRQFTIKVS